MEKIPLAEQMRALAEQGHARASELREAAEALAVAKRAWEAQEGEAPTKRLLGAWARARLLWRDCTQEPLV